MAQGGWRDKDDLDLDASDLGEMLDAGSAVAVSGPGARTWTQEGSVGINCDLGLRDHL